MIRRLIYLARVHINIKRRQCGNFFFFDRPPKGKLLCAGINIAFIDHAGNFVIFKMHKTNNFFKMINRDYKWKFHRRMNKSLL